MSNHSRRTNVPEPPPVEFPPPVADPARLEWVKRAYAEIGYRLLEWQQEFGLTSPEFLSVILRCGQDHLAGLTRSERAGERPPREPGLGGPTGAGPKPET